MHRADRLTALVFSEARTLIMCLGKPCAQRSVHLSTQRLEQSYRACVNRTFIKMRPTQFVDSDDAKQRITALIAEQNAVQQSTATAARHDHRWVMRQ